MKARLVFAGLGCLLLVASGCFRPDNQTVPEEEHPLKLVAGNQQLIIGKAFVVDGDSLRVRRTEIRLWGLDAPEWHQNCLTKTDEIYRCGVEAKEAMIDILRKDDFAVSCQAVQGAKDYYGRVLAYCESAGKDIVALMIEAGWAVRYEQRDPPRTDLYDHYGKLRDAARAGRFGVWQGCFTEPRKWRRDTRECPGKI